MNTQYSPEMIKAAAEVKGIPNHALATLLDCSTESFDQWVDASVLAIEGPVKNDQNIDISRIGKLCELLNLEFSEEEGCRYLTFPGTPVFYIKLVEPFSPAGREDASKLYRLVKAADKSELLFVEPDKKKMFGLKANAQFITKFYFKGEKTAYAVIEIKGSLFKGFGLDPEELPNCSWPEAGESIDPTSDHRNQMFKYKSVSAEILEEYFKKPVVVEPEPVQEPINATAQGPEQTLNQAASLAGMNEKELLLKLVTHMISTGAIKVEELGLGTSNVKVEPTYNPVQDILDSQPQIDNTIKATGPINQ